jgi:hypothetical protein
VTTPAISYERWTELLAERFFRPEFAGTHVMFFVDDACLAELAQRDSEAAVSSLVEAIVPKLRRSVPWKLFAPIVSATAAWKAHDQAGPPPSLPVLALTVLAATRMQRTGKTPAHAYYTWLIALLRDAGVRGSDDELITAFRDSMYQLWRWLRWWLNDRNAGRLGITLIDEDASRRFVGLADSQTLFASSDRAKLSQLFGWIGLRPGESIEERELLALFRLWADPRDDLTPGTLAALEDDKYPAQLASILAAAARDWKGVVRDDAGRKEAVLRVALRPTRPAWLGLVAPRPPGFPSSLELPLPDGRELALTAEEEGIGEDELQWYDGLDVELTRRMLDIGLVLTSGEHALRLPPYHYHVLHKSRELGCWASEPQLRPGEPAWLLVRDQALDEVLGFLEQHARPGWEPVQAAELAPAGWQLVRGVTVDEAPAGLQGVLARLSPRHTNRTSLNGGLPLAQGRDVYLTGGEPDLLLPPRPGSSDAPRVTVDGEPLSLAPNASSVRLADLDLVADKPHHVTVDGATRTVTSRSTVGLPAPRVRRAVGHRFASEGGRIVPLSVGAQTGIDGADGELQIQGAAVLGEAPGAERRRPLALPVGARRLVLLGARPGQVETPLPPRRPPWLAKAGLEYRVFEHEPRFDVAWLITESRFRPLHARLIRALEPLAPGEPVDPSAAGTWRTAVLNSEPPADEQARQLWERYRLAVKGGVSA